MNELIQIIQDKTEFTEFPQYQCVLDKFVLCANSFYVSIVFKYRFLTSPEYLLILLYFPTEYKSPVYVLTGSLINVFNQCFMGSI